MFLNELFITEDNRHVAFCYGRFQPPHGGHKLLMETTAKAADGGAYQIYTSASQDPKKNPLDYRTKIHFIKEMFPDMAKQVVDAPELNTIMKVAASLYERGFRSATFVAGTDQIDSFRELLNKYNGVDSAHGFYDFRPLNFVTSNSPDVRATQIREAAANGDIKVFGELTQAGDLTQQLYDAVRKGMNIKDTPAPVESMLPASAFTGSKKNKLGTAGQLKGKMKRPARAGDLVGEATFNNCVKLSEGWEQQISNLVSLLERKQLNELMTYASNKGYEGAGVYKRYDIFVSRKKFNNIAFIAVAENPRDRRVAHKGQGSTKDAALADIRSKIDQEIDVATKVSGQATLDFNVDFVREILEMSSDRFYAKIIPGPKLVIVGKDMEQYPEIMSSEGFKGSTIRNVKDSEGTTKLPGLPLSSKTAAATNLIANGRYVLGGETIDKDGNRVFDLEFDSVVADKGERMRMRAPALTVGTNR